MSWAEVKKINSDMDKPLDELINERAGIAPSNMVRFEAVGIGNKIMLYIEGPGDTIIEGQTICTIAGVKVMRKNGGYPETENEGTLIMDISREDLAKYATDPYFEETLTNNTTYYYAAFPYSDRGVYNRNPKNRSSGTTKKYEMYGFWIDPNDSNPATRVSYVSNLDNADWEPMTVNLTTGEYDLKNWKNAFFIRKCRPVMLKYDGTVDYELDHNDQTKKLDGTPSDISNPNYEGNAMVEFPKMYFERGENKSVGKHLVRVSDTRPNTNFDCYAHMRDGKELDHIYLPMFEGSKIGADNPDGTLNGKLRSLADQTPEVNHHYFDEVNLAFNNGLGWQTDDWMNAQMITHLLFLLGKTTDLQGTFGAGHCFEDRNNIGPLLQTGTLKNKGMFCGYTSENDALKNRAVKFFWLENYYGNKWDRKAGLIYGTDGHIKVKPYPAYDYDGNGYIDTGLTITGPASSDGGVEGYISKTKMTEYGEFPIEVNGSYTTHQPDAGFADTNELNFLYWGSDLQGQYGGGAGINLACPLNVTGPHRGASLSYKGGY